MEKVISKDGTIIAYNKTGKGFPLILVDGALCSTDFGPMPQLAVLLADHFTVIHYDRRGRHESGDNKPYAPEREIEDIEALINMAGGSAYVAGVSSGAALALLATAKGLNIPKLALYEPPYVGGNDRREPPSDAQDHLKALVAGDKRADAVKYFMRDMVGVPSFVVFMMGLFPIFKKLKVVAHTLPYDAAVLGDWHVPEKEAASIKIPVLVGGGDKSQAELKYAVNKVADALPNKELKMFKGQTHNISPKVLAPALIEFFNK